MAMLLVMVMLLPMIGMAQPVMAAESGEGFVTEDDGVWTDDNVICAAQEPELTSESDAEETTVIVTATTTYGESTADAQDAAGDAQEGDATMVPGGKGMVFGIRKASRSTGATEDGYDVSSKWSFSVTWQKEADPYDMGTKTASFAPMYQVNFHSDLDTLRPGQVVIRMPASLFELTDENGRKQGDRNGKLVLPSQVAVPKGTYVEGEAGTFEESNVSPFNYDIVDNDHGSKNIVFWNYKEIPSGTTAAWQVAYPKQDLNVISNTTFSPSCDIIDGSKINLTPSIGIPDWKMTEVRQDEYGNNLETVVHTGSISATATPLTGLVDTSVRIISVAVRCIRLTSESDLKMYIGEVPAEYSGENFEKYYYARGYARYTCTTGNQPRTISFEITESYATGPDNTTVQGIKLGGGVYAYLKTDLKEYPRFYVTGKSTCHPVDGLDADTTATGTDYVYIPEPTPPKPPTPPSYWVYHGDTIGTNKSVSNAPVTLWQLDYKDNKSKGLDTVFGSYKVTSLLRGYKFTHDVDSKGLGPNEYKGGSFALMASDDVLYAWSSKNTNNKVMLTADDYYMSKVSVDAYVYGQELYETDNGGTDERGKYPELADYADRDLVIQAMFAYGDDPDKWVDVVSIPWKNATQVTGCDYASNSEMVGWRAYDYMSGYKVSYIFTEDDLAKRPYRVRAIQSCQDYRIDINIFPEITLRHDSATINEMIDNNDWVTVENLCAASGVADPYTGGRLIIADGTVNEYYSPLNYTTYVQKNGYQTELATVTEELYDGDGEIFGEGWTYTPPMRKNASASVYNLDYILEYIGKNYKDADIVQSVSNTNDVARGRVNLSYGITGYEGYSVDGPITKKYMPLPDRTEVKIYDLLPVGVHLDRDVAPTAKDPSHGVEVTDIIANYDNTGRELVEFTITCPEGLAEGSNVTGRISRFDKYYHYYQQNAGIVFKAYIAWDDMESSNIGPNIAVWIPSDGGPIIGKDTQISLDNGTVVPGHYCYSYSTYSVYTFSYTKSNFVGSNGMSLLGSDINGDSITDTRSVLYSSSTATTNYAVAYEAGIDKKVRADAGGVAMNAIEIKPGEDYTYDFIIKSYDATSVKDVTVFDQIENVETNHWQGIFRGVSYDDAVEHGATGVTVWYNADREAPMPDNKIASTLTAENVLTAANGWVEASEWTAPLADVKAVAMQLGGMDLGKEQSVTVQIHMTAPDQETFEAGTSAYGTAWNRAHMLATIQSYAGSAAQTGMHDSRDVSVAVLPEKPYLYMSKVLEGVPEGVDTSNEEFTFQVKLYDKSLKAFVPASDREYWVVEAACLDGAIPVKLEDGRTDADGNVTFKAGQVVAFQVDYPHQRFEITEPEPGIGWRCAENEATGFVDDYGTEASITNTWNRLAVTKNLAEKTTTNDAAQAFDMLDGTYGFKLVDGEYTSDNKGKDSTTATSTWTAKYDMDSVSFKYSYSSESGYDKFTLTVAGKTIENAVSGATTVKTWSGSLKAGDTIVMKYTKDSSSHKNDDQCKIYDISILVYSPVDTADDTEFTFELKDASGNPVADAPLVIGAVSGSTDANGRFHLKAGQTASIAVANGDYTVTEVPAMYYKQVVPANGEAARVTVSDDGSGTAEFLNAEDNGYVFPKTGGIGTMPVYAAGGMLAATALAVLLYGRLRKRRI